MPAVSPAVVGVLATKVAILGLLEVLFLVLSVRMVVNIRLPWRQALLYGYLYAVLCAAVTVAEQRYMSAGGPTGLTVIELLFALVVAWVLATVAYATRIRRDDGVALGVLPAALVAAMQTALTLLAIVAASLAVLYVRRHL